MEGELRILIKPKPVQEPPVENTEPTTSPTTTKEQDKQQEQTQEEEVKVQRILSRPQARSTENNKDIQNQPIKEKSFQEREEEYAKARQRIFQDSGASNLKDKEPAIITPARKKTELPPDERQEYNRSAMPHKPPNQIPNPALLKSANTPKYNPQNEYEAQQAIKLAQYSYSLLMQKQQQQQQQALLAAAAMNPMLAKPVPNQLPMVPIAYNPYYPNPMFIPPPQPPMMQPQNPNSPPPPMPPYYFQQAIPQDLNGMIPNYMAENGMRPPMPRATPPPPASTTPIQDNTFQNPPSMAARIRPPPQQGCSMDFSGGQPISPSPALSPGGPC